MKKVKTIMVTLINKMIKNYLIKWYNSNKKMIIPIISIESPAGDRRTNLQLQNAL
jgi:hypothetical protein